MKIIAYSQLYLSKASRIVGNMLHDAVITFGLDGNDFLRLFIQSGVAEQIENGNPKYLAGKSGLELYLEVIEKTTGQSTNVELIESYDRSDVYWVGWMLTHYQWYSGRSFESILDIISYDELLSLYGTLHEADIQKSYEIIDAHFEKAESALKTTRKRRGLTQEALAEKTGISVNTIRAYERKSKALSKANVDTIMRIAKVLRCDIADLLK